MTIAETRHWQERQRRGSPIVIGHRGLAARAPENTLASYRMAIELGVAIVECDVHLTEDQFVVVIHDGDLKRTTGADGKVAERTLEEIRRLDAGRWKGPEFAGEKIPTLDELLSLTRGKAVLVIELKAPGMEEAVVESMRRMGVGADGVIIFAWDTATLDRIRAHEPALVTTLLVSRPPIDPAGRARLFDEARQHEVPILGVENRDLDRAFFAGAHAAGLEVYVWTVNEQADILRLTDLGADGIISDDAYAACKAGCTHPPLPTTVPRTG